MRSLSSSEQSFLDTLFNFLREEQIRFVLLRNYQGLPTTIGNDLDIFVSQENLASAKTCLCKALESHKGKLVHVHKRGYFEALWMAFDSNATFLHIDFYPGAFTWHGIQYLSDKDLLEQAIESNNYPVPRPAHEALSLYLTSLLWGGFYKVRYHKEITLLLNSPEELAVFKKYLVKIFGAKAWTDFAAIRDAPEQSILAKKSVKHLREKLSFQLVKSPVDLWNYARHWAIEFSTLIFPPGICVAFLGPDGAGKSTIIKETVEQLGSLFGGYKIFHWRPSVLPDVGVLLKRRKASTAPVTNPQSGKPHGFISSLFRLFYYWLDYWLGFFVVQRLKAKNHLVIFDRYSWDMIVDPKRYKLGLSETWISFFMKKVPQPNLVFLLDAPAEVLQKRKQEVPLEETRRQLTKYIECTQTLPSLYVINVNQTPEEIVKNARAILIKKLEKHSL